MPNAYTQTLNLFGEEKHAPGTPEYVRAAEAAARRAVTRWLTGVDGRTMHRFDVDGVECALELFTGHWGEAGSERWRCGRTGEGDPDEDYSDGEDLDEDEPHEDDPEEEAPGEDGLGEDILLEIALGRRLDPARRRARRQAAPPPYAGGDLTLEEIAAAAEARAEANLGKLVLHPMG